MNIFRVKIGYDIAVVAKDKTDAENKARWELREGDDLRDERAHVKVTEIGLDGALPENWEEGCAPYGENPHGHSIRWWRDELRPRQEVTFRIVGSANVIAQARRALKEFEATESLWVLKEEKKGA